MLDCLPEELFFEILSRLPVKAIIRFRCVSKTRCSLISSPHFIATHLNRSLSNPEHPPYLLFRRFANHLSKASLTLHSSDIPFSRYNLTELRSSHQNTDKLKIVAGSSNGLLCLAGTFWGPVCDPYVFWNPSIQKAITLPDHNVGIRFSCNLYINLLGFGYVPKTDDYKLVRLVFRYSDPNEFDYKIPRWVQIYTLRTHAWRPVRVHGPPSRMKMGVTAAFFRGRVHWPARVGRHRSARRHAIVAFDLEDEEFREVGMPMILQEADYHRYVVAAVHGLLALVPHENRSLEYKSVWVMKEYGVVESWTELLEIKMFIVDQVIGVRENGEGLLTGPGKMCSYESSSQQTVYLRGTVTGFLDKYVESLVLLDVQA